METGERLPKQRPALLPHMSRCSCVRARTLRRALPRPDCPGGQLCCWLRRGHALKGLLRCGHVHIMHRPCCSRKTTPHQLHQTAPHHTTRHDTTCHITTHHNTTRHATTHHNTTQHNTTRRHTTQYNTTQHNITRHSTTRHNPSPHATTQRTTTRRTPSSSPPTPTHNTVTQHTATDNPQPTTSHNPQFPPSLSKVELEQLQVCDRLRPDIF